MATQSHSSAAFSVLDLPLMCRVYPIFRAKCQVSEATEHFRADDRERLARELVRLEEENAEQMQSSMIDENNTKEELRLVDILLTRFRATKSDDQERLIIAAMRKLIDKYENYSLTIIEYRVKSFFLISSKLIMLFHYDVFSSFHSCYITVFSL